MMAFMRWMARLLVLAGVACCGCGPAGPEIRVTADPADWTPARVAVLMPGALTGVIPAVTTLPEGVWSSTIPEAASACASALIGGLRASATDIAFSMSTAFTRTETAGLVDTVTRQYTDARMVDPTVAKALGEALGADAYLVTALLRYGPEVDGDAQQVSKGVSAPVKTTDLGINVSSSYIIVYFNAQFRSALIRTSDGAIVWDASCRQRERRGGLRTITQESVLKAGVDAMVSAFPWRTHEPESPDH